MALHIKKQENVYVLSGSLTADQVFELGRFFNLKLHEEERMLISLSDLDAVDISAALMFKQLLSQAKMRSKDCIIYGLNNRKIQGAFRHTNMTNALAA